MAWNARPERKPFYLIEDQSSFVSSGEPVFEHDKAIVARRFSPDPQAVEEFRDAWLNDENAPVGTAAQLARARSIERQLGFEEGWPGKYESVAERALRIRAELMRSRVVLASITNRAPEYLAWPGGAYDGLAVGIAIECGFKAYTLGSRDSRSRRNRPGEDPSSLKRIHTKSRLFVRGVYCGVMNGYYQLLLMRVHQKSLIHAFALYAYKTLALTRTLLAGPRR